MNDSGISPVRFLAFGKLNGPLISLLLKCNNTDFVIKKH